MVAIAAALLVGATACGSEGNSRNQAGSTDQASTLARPQTYGRGALPAEASRTVEVEMHDDFRFAPDEIAVEPGEVITFRLVNVGKLPHEFTIGGPVAQKIHEEKMSSMEMGEMGMGSHGMAGDHTSPSVDEEAADRIAALEAEAAASTSVHVAPGATKEVTWAFSGEELPVYGCHVPGHWDAGMRGSFHRS